MRHPHRVSTYDVTLPIGFTDATGRAHRRAGLRKMRGSEELLFYDSTLSGADLVTELLVACLTKLGDVPSIDAQTVAALYCADRNYLLLELRSVTFGPELRASYSCPTCHATVRILEDLSALPVRMLADGEMPAEIVVDLEDGFVDREGVRHTQLVLALPCGSDEAFVSRMAERDALKARDALLLRCVRRFGTLPKKVLEGYGVKILRDLTLGDRRRIQRALTEGTPGVAFEHSVDCPSCATTFPALLDVSDFFVLT